MSHNLKEALFGAAKKESEMSSNDPNFNAGFRGYNAPANNSPDATHQWNKGREEANRRHQEAMRQAWGPKK